MGGIKKIKRNSPDLAKILINKMLENHDIDYDYVMANQHIDGKVWCSHYEWTQEQSDNYKDWWMDFFRNNVSPKMSKTQLKKEWSWFDLMYGLRIKEE